MASKYWIKLYHEILRDPKMGRLPDEIWRRAIELFLIAGQEGTDGWLPSVDDMAWILRVSQKQLEVDLRALKNAGIVKKENGRWFVTRFAQRQAPSSDAERQQRYRQRQREEQYNGNEPVTKSVTETSRTHNEKLVEPEPESEPKREPEPDNTGANAPASPLAPETPGQIMLFERLGEEYKAKRRRSPKRFKSLACKQKFTKAELRLGLGELEKAIGRALEKSILSIDRITDWVAKWGLSTSPGAEYATSDPVADYEAMAEREGWEPWQPDEKSPKSLPY